MAYIPSLHKTHYQLWYQTATYHRSNEIDFRYHKDFDNAKDTAEAYLKNNDYVTSVTITLNDSSVFHKEG